MEQNTKPFIVTRDGQLDKELSLLPDQKNPLDKVKQGREIIRLQLQMIVYDLFHGTHYRTIRNTLVREKRNQEFELAIGIMPLDKK